MIGHITGAGQPTQPAAHEIFDEREGRPRWPMGVLAVAGLIFTGYLTIEAFGRAPLAGCGAGEPCHQAMTSSWSRWLGMPISAGAAMLYLSLIVILLIPTTDRRRQVWQWAGLRAIGLVLAGAAVWCFYLLLFRIRAMCPYCTVAHIIGLATAAVIIRSSRTAYRGAHAPGRSSVAGDGVRQWLVAVVIAGVALGGLIGGQLLFPTPTFALTPSANMPDSGTEAAAAGSTGHAGHDHQKNDASETPPPVGAFYRWEDGRRVVACDFTDVVLDPRQQPMLGPPDASHLVILMFDYTCSHCHAMHELLQLARSRYGDQLGVLLVTWPINAACNPMIPADTATTRDGACEYAKLAIALWRISPEAFQTFDSWVVSFDQSPPLDLGIRKAIDLVGRERLQEELAKPQIAETLQRNLRFSKPLADHFRTVPIVLLENRYLTGVPERYDQFYQILERELGLKAPSSRPLQP